MASGLRKFAAIACLTGGMGLVGALAQENTQDDPLADLLTPRETDEQSTQTGPAETFDPYDSETGVSDPATNDYGQSAPRLAPIFAPDYVPTDPNAMNLPDDGDVSDETGDQSTDGDDLDAEDEGDLGEVEYMKQPAALLRGLDKITGRSRDIEVGVDGYALFGGLRVNVKACHQTPPTEAPESIAYIEVEDFGFEIQAMEKLPDEIDREKRVFNGWMFASSPGLNALEHPIYDVWVIRCMAEAPVSSEDDSDL